MTEAEAKVVVTNLNGYIKSLIAQVRDGGYEELVEETGKLLVESLVTK